MNQKKLLILLGLSAAFTLTACGSKNTDAQTAVTEAQAAETEDTQKAATEKNDMEKTGGEDGSTEELLLDTEDDTDTEAALDPVTPSDYLIKNASEYVTLGELDGIEVTKYVYEITDDMVDEAIQNDLDMYSYEEEADRASADGDIVYLDLTCAVQGSDEDAETESTYFSIGYEEYGTEFDEQLTGVKAGDHLTFSITFDDDIWIEEWIGQTVDFTADITSVCEIFTPEYDEEFIAEYTDYETAEEYEAALRDQLVLEYEDISYSDALDSLFETAISNSEFSSYPEDLYDACKEELLSFYGAFVGTTEEEEIYEAFGMTEDDIRSDIEYSVYRRLLVSAICEEKGIELTQEDYFTYLEENASYYDYDNASDFEADYTRSTLIWSLYESKVADLLYESAEVTEAAYEEELLSEDEFYEETE